MLQSIADLNCTWMETEIYSTHPVARAIIAGTAPAQARMAAAKGILPLPTSDLLEVLVYLAGDSDDALAQTALATFIAQENIFEAVSSEEIAPAVLDFVAATTSFERSVYEAVINNLKTPDEAIVKFVSNSTDGSLIELATLNQQRLIRTPAILDAILANGARTVDAERRAQETRQEFFEKSRGAEQIAAELRAQGNTAAAEFIEEIKEDFIEDESDNGITYDDLTLFASLIEVSDDEIDDSWLSFGSIEEFYEETEEQRQAIFNKIRSEIKGDADDEDNFDENAATVYTIMKLKLKKRLKLALKGNRLCRSVLIRDTNRIIAQAVLQNPKITEQEVEKIAAMRSVSDEILRNIGLNKTFSRSYSVIHNLARNPRTPIATSLNLMNRIQTKDLKAISANRNVSEAIRRQAIRLLATRN